MVKLSEKEQAIRLRKKGLTYSEIMEEVPVAKSTLSLWLSAIPLKKTHKERIQKKIRLTSLRTLNKQWGVNSEAFRIKRAVLVDSARVELDRFEVNSNTLAFIGAALYWAEGSREGFRLANTDMYMVEVYLLWLRNVLGVATDRIVCRVAKVHLGNGVSYDDVEKKWSEVTNVPRSQFRKPTIIEKGDEISFRKRIHVYGMLEVSVLRPLEYKAKFAVLMEKMGFVPPFVLDGTSK